MMFDANHLGPEAATCVTSKDLPGVDVDGLMAVDFPGGAKSMTHVNEL